jgi:hypothetical protein
MENTKIYCKVTLRKNIGHKTEREVFVKGESYKYWFLSSGWNSRQVEPKEGPVATFTEDEFYEYFQFSPIESNKQ